MLGVWVVVTSYLLPASDAMIMIAMDFRFEFGTPETKRVVRLAKV
jgi:hypothetical protein